MNLNKNGILITGSTIERTLPAGYTELEYIESSGTQYIDTSVNLNNKNFKVSTSISLTEYTTQEQAIMSIWTQSYGYWNCFLASDKKLDLYLSGHKKLSTIMQLDTIYNIGVERNSNNWILTLNNENDIYSYTPSSDNETTLKLFTRGDTPGTGSSNTHIKMYSCKIYLANVLIRNFIPAQRNNDSVLGIYDTANDVFYTNAGSGTFIAGPIVETSSANVQIFQQKLPNAAKVITELDNSKWIQLFHHNNPTSSKFASTDTFTTGVYKDTDRWFNLNLCDKFSKWEILLIQKTSSNVEQKYRWIQNVNPMIATFEETKTANTTFITTSGYTTPGSNYGGLWYKNSSAYLVANNNNSGNWYGAIGAWNAFNGGIPGYNGTTVTDGYIDVYLRIDNDSITDAVLNRLLIKNNYVEASDFIEL